MARRYPKIHIQSKNELAKHISDEKFSVREALNLINDVLANYDRYWKDSRRSEPLKGKYVRSAFGTPLGQLLERINRKVLAPHDALLPPYIFGGVQGLNHIKAARHLLGRQRKRTLLALDIATFFEQIKQERVEHFLVAKCRCSKRAARLISNLCCVPQGAKGSTSTTKSIGRGFATSSRLAMWCNLDTFIGLDRLIKKRLKKYDPRLAIYVDDIGITASRVPYAMMEAVADETDEFLKGYDKHQPLPSKREKRKILSHADNMQHLGLGLKRGSLMLGIKTRKKLDNARMRMKNPLLSRDERVAARRTYRSLMRYRSKVMTLKKP